MLGSMLYFLEETLLAYVFYLLATGILLRILLFVVRIATRQRTTAPPIGSPESVAASIALLMGSLLPFHRAALKRPLYSGLRYLFHSGLIIVPIWFSGHIALWEESRFEWYWTPLSDELIDYFTLAVIVLAAVFSLRRLLLPEVRRRSGWIDHLIILIAALPFITGYWYTHGTLEHLAFFESYLGSLHVISGEAMLVMAVFLFCVTRLTPKSCVGCAACESSCPTATLVSENRQATRYFKYAPSQCICCGACVNVCPESAAELRHVLSLGNFLNPLGRRVIAEAPLATCERCGAPFAPGAQLAKLEEILAGLGRAELPLNTCNRCKKILAGRQAHFELRN